jgi:hypothetical protein
MKIIFAILLMASLFIGLGCKKEAKLCCAPPPDANLLGKWVDVNKREDTLEVYIEGGRGILFDNSAYYRNNQATITDKNSYRMVYQFKDGKIGVKQYSAPTSAEFYYFDLTWIQQGMKFTMLQNAIRPYISSLPMGTYERVN